MVCKLGVSTIEYENTILIIVVIETKEKNLSGNFHASPYTVVHFLLGFQE